MEVGYSENDKQVVLMKVDDSVWKTPNEASSRFLVEHRICFRKLLYAANREKDLPQKLVAEAGFFVIVLFDRIVKLNLGDLKKSDIHLALYSARTSSADTVAAAPDL